MDWVRGPLLGSGSFATVNLAFRTNSSAKFPSPTAVKSSDISTSQMLENEKNILQLLGSSPYIVKYFGDDHTFENGEEYYNLFLEYAPNGTVFDQLKIHGGNLPLNLVRKYTRSIVEGLVHVHGNGLVHCDVKLQNILVFENDHVKITDFGLAKKKNERQSKCQCRGTPMFMSPELVNENECESPGDVWALGCAVVEMVTGKPAWKVSGEMNIWALLIRIGVGEELPEIPDELPEDGKDFLKKCFVKDPSKRWSADMLLAHPFIAHDTISLKKVKECECSPSPTTQFGFPHLDSSYAFTPSSEFSPPANFCSPQERLLQLVTDQVPANWSESDSWNIVRSS